MNMCVYMYVCVMHVQVINAPSNCFGMSISSGGISLFQTPMGQLHAEHIGA